MEQDKIQELIIYSKHGDTKTFGMLVTEFQPLVFRLAFRLLCNDDDAKDMVQEVFVRAWLQLDRYNPQYRFSTWIYKITANMCCDRLRSAKRARESTGIPSALSERENIASTENTESSVINSELKELILYFTDRLTPKQKTVFILKDVEGLETEEIEKITGLSAGQIKSNLHLARKYIRNKINSIS
ncbi:MAG: sigma-70 family RNA polymerase sigma factor [Prevotellaceae bacterium]|jgi:RNA polymerase sigma-70 factor (ECF subfamily)|nr:sigma-70 family RNA polymerase sigma factor [Prevotellaceae bacterium]